MTGMTWQWPWAALIALVACIALVVLLVVLMGRREHNTDPVFSLAQDLRTDEASRLMVRWRRMKRIAAVLLACSLAVSIALVSRPSAVDTGEERANSRDIVLCLDVSGSTLPYDRQVIETYIDLVSRFQGERIALSIFNSTSRTVFPLTDDYPLVLTQLKSAASILRKVQSQDDIDKMSDRDYQKISDWLDGTQNRKDATSLIGDGLVSCAAMLPGFAYGDEQMASNGQRRASSIVLATDNVVSGNPTYTLQQALDLTRGAKITVDGLFSGPRQSEGDDTTTQMRTAIESHGGVFHTRTSSDSVDALVRDIERRRDAQNRRRHQTAVIDAPFWWMLALATLAAVWRVMTWRLRR
ncbi:MAG: VWA domain-containing protein [Bifidobacterium mongoliense]|uniref:VWA domain-containing protein n=2 Tax=Bifidobacterium mongoliense TaxID=518643 RepID=UPI002647444B|nr:VWA domain-containing protein [Bifidobacterium mongoliense]MDN6026045.1 VWA domain-containing protein [Bifidobacterium mongoliense]MDN6051785.1 VWA domain-containing protein [Bifidobacterium mongoliense]